MSGRPGQHGGDDIDGSPQPNMSKSHSTSAGFRPNTQQNARAPRATDVQASNYANHISLAKPNKYETKKITHEPVPMNERERVKDAPCGLKNVGNSK